MASSIIEPRDPAQYAGVNSSGQGAVFSGNNIAGRDIIVIESTASLARSLHGCFVKSSGSSNQLASYISSMAEALDHAKRCLDVEALDSPYHEKLTSIVTGCSKVLLDIQDQAKNHENSSQEDDYQLNEMVVRTENLATLKLDLNSHIVALNLITNSMGKDVMERIEGAIQQLIAQTRTKDQMFHDEGIHHSRVKETLTENPSSQELHDVLNPDTREGSVFSSTDSLTADEKKNWRRVRKELEETGITEKLFQQQEGFITSRLREVIDGGALEEGATMTHSEPGVLPPAQLIKTRPTKADKFLNALGYRRQDKLLIAAIWTGNDARAKKCLERGARVNVDADDSPEWDQKNPLLLAIRYRNEAIVRLLLEHGADIEVTTIGGKTPLLLAASIGRKDVVQVLLEHRADIEARDEDKCTPLIRAARDARKRDTLQVLLEGGADIEARDKSKYTPLIWAARCSSRDTVQVLLEGGADIEATDGDGKTPLIHAVGWGEDEVLQVLLAHGANVRTECNLGLNAIDWGRGDENGNKESILNAHLESIERQEREQERARNPVRCEPRVQFPVYTIPRYEAPMDYHHNHFNRFASRTQPCPCYDCRFSTY
ncbi:MAG: hypothetical protein M1836_006468 [Candelina mexicana]|nr:MAG: hypothetical protein M1836_006468 [Candelina mexicana]